MLEQDFVLKMKSHILSASIDQYGDNYWVAVAKGILILFEYKEKIAKDRLSYLYEELRLELSDLALDNITEDLSDEFCAILTRGYPMPDFWSENLEDFKKHPNFSRYFNKVL